MSPVYPWDASGTGDRAGALPAWRDAVDAVLASPEKPSLTAMGPIVRGWYAMPGNEAGGLLHVVLDDGNVDSSFVRFCQHEAKEQKDGLAYLLATALLRCSRTQRAKLATGTYRRGAP